MQQMSDPQLPSTVRVAVMEAPAESPPGSTEWNELAAAARELQPDLLLLDEMPFGRWLAGSPVVDRAALDRSVQLHREGLDTLGDFGASVVLGSRPVQYGARFVNEAFVWTPTSGVSAVHTKQFFPQEEGYWEESWFSRGETHFRTAATPLCTVAFLICTEVMFNEWARYYGRNGAQLLAVPRVTPASSTERWRTAVTMAAIVSGGYSISSNRGGRDSQGSLFGGNGWIISPWGDLLASTAPATPVAAADIDLATVAKSRTEYPCYVKELPNQ